ncbi:MAG: UDP-N-acetylmuramoyl-tripeptide--D-alanyl-D-alanine ligase [Clostridiales bacterium]|nr:UDP-N-acetylmuramoyl-tripeptide--D-alanyl-D-alanine ligase [Clostridiales bacterium]
MGEVELRVVASLLTAVLLCLSTLKMMGALQQSGYKNGVFFRWLKRKDNLYFNRLAVLSLCLALTSAVTVLCFSFLPKNGPLLVAWIPFFGLLFLFVRMDSKYALKVNVHFTGRLKRLFAVYFFFTACVAYIFIAGLGFLSELNGSHVYGLVAYIPFAVMPVLTPILLTGASAVTSVFEEKRNRKFIKRAGQVLDEREIIRIGVVGSYGKTTVKHILYTLLSEKYAVVATPESFNTPMGLAKTVLSPDFDKKQIFIAEMGARKHGDIAELCDLIHPDYAVFTGVCEQHIQGFGSIENVWAEKSEILKCGAKKVFCGGSLRKLAEGEFANKIGESIFVDESDFEVDTGAAATVFTMKVYGENIQFKTALLGRMAAENIRLAVMLCIELGMTAEEIMRGVEKLQPVPHRLQLSHNNGVYILDDGYNCNPKGAEEALTALSRFSGRKCLVTPGIVECGVLEEKINGELGEKIASFHFEKVILVGNTLVACVKKGFENAGGDMTTLTIAESLDKAQTILKGYLQEGDAVLFLNDLPDVY